MSSRFLSRHIPDFDLITFYAENGETFFFRISPWTKLVWLFFLVVFVTVSRDLILLAGLYILLVFLFLLSGLPVRKLVAWYTLPALFVLSLVGLLAFGEPGIPLFSVTIAGLPVSLSDNGVLLVAGLLLRALIVITYSLLFLMTTRYLCLTGMISRIFPSPLDQIFLMSYRFLSLTLSMADGMLKAVYSRGGGLLHSLRTQARLFARVFALIFIHSFERGERVHKAMLARGFSGTYPLSGEVPRPGVPEYGLLATTGVLVLIAVMLSPYRGW